MRRWLTQRADLRATSTRRWLLAALVLASACGNDPRRFEAEEHVVGQLPDGGPDDPLIADPRAHGGAPGGGDAYFGSSIGGGAGGSSGVGGGAGGQPLLAVSFYCGDGVRDPDDEECDDGAGPESDLCTDRCQVADTAVVPLPATLPAPPDLKGRYLGEGRHPAAGSEHGFGVVFVEPGADSASIGLSVFDPAGDPRARIELGEATQPVLFANPVLAALADGSYAAAWTEFGGDGDELGIALRRVTPALVPNGGAEPPIVGAALGATLSRVQFANADTDFSQYDADILAVGSTLVVAWTDVTDPVTAPDIHYRTFSTTAGAQTAFPPTSSDRILSASEDIEGNVALARFGTSWAAAWRSGRADGLETIEVFAAESGTRWSVTSEFGGHLPGSDEDRPALAEIDATHLLLAFTAGTDPLETSVANVGRLRVAVLTVSNPLPAVFEVQPMDPDYADPALAQSHPSLERVGDKWFVGWRSASRESQANGEDLWLAELSPQIFPDTVGLVRFGELRIPRFAAGSLGDQRFPALAAVPPLLGTPGLPGPAPEGGLLVAWDDFGQTLGAAQGKPDVLAAFYPASFVRFAEHEDCTPQQPCTAGEGDCDSSAECVPGLVCAIGIFAGPKHGWGPDVDVCVAPHCTNGVRDLDEGGIDCGGADCGTCLCGDAVWLPAVGEACDQGGDTAQCDSDCTFPQCGDHHANLAANEACDNGVVDTAQCDGDCSAATCGDGHENTPAGEECDDGNSSNNDACVGSCDDARCGDGFVRTVAPTEACDSGGQNTATCDSDCTAPQCGDGLLNQAAGELCEPSLTPGCNADCHGFSACSNPATCPLVVEHIGGTQPTGDNFVNAQVRIRNNTTQPVAVNQLKFRYWLTRNDDTLACTNPLSFSTPCDFPNPVNGVCPGVAFSVTNVSPELNQVDTRVEVTLSGAEIIAPNSFKDVNFRIVRNISGNLNENNDYSYQSGSAHTANSKIALYLNNQLAWGVEPSVVRFCGDNITSGCEACDTGGVNTATCDSNCTTAQCGDGFLNTAAGETCEPNPAPESTNCDSDCTARTCGDHHVNPVGGEICESSVTGANCAHCGTPACGAGSSIPIAGCSSCTSFSSGCTDGRLCLKLQYRPGPGDTSGDNQVRPHFKIVNNGFTTIPLSQLKIRYYFTIDGSATLQFNCDFASLPGGGTCSNVSGAFVTLSPTKPTADRYLEISFTGSGSLAPCESTGEIQVRFNKVGFPNLNESNDYSYQATANFVDRVQVVLRRNTSTFWGTPP